MAESTPLTERSTDALIDSYIKIRDRKEELAKQQKEELSKYTRALSAIEVTLLGRLNEDGAEKIGTPHGTCYKQVRTSARVVDWDAVLTYITENEQWQMLERRVSKSAVDEHIEAVGSTPPGVDITQEIRVNVRR
jgi:hypothetical protein